MGYHDNAPSHSAHRNLATTVNDANRTLFLDYPSYREYTIVALPQLTTLDGREITRTERLKAQQNFDENRRKIVQLQVSRAFVHGNTKETSRCNRMRGGERKT